LFAKEGAKVVVNDVGGARDGSGSGDAMASKVVDEIKAAGGDAAANFSSVATPEGAASIIKTAVDAFGRVDILVNNAGILRDKMSFNMDEAEWDAVIDVHLKGHFAPSRFAASHWRAACKATGAPVNGKIVNTASESGLYGNAGQANYAAAKAGIAAMTIVMARELERIGVRVNAVTPTARTRLTDTVATGGFMDKKEGEFDRFAPENISAVVCWLASDLSEGVTGQVVKVMGGQVQLLTGWKPVTQADADTEWTVASIDAISGALFAKTGKGVPVFMPPVEP
jgi:NAD(P)-dependent dehydrogenase (short-subunit alcohol dehydrogenase family)